MRRLALAFILLVACVDDTPLRAPSPGSVRLSIAMAIAGQAEQSVAIRAFYRRSGGAEVDLPVSPDRLLLQSATTSERNLTVDIGACFNDELREEAAGDGCVLHVAVQLLGADGLSLSGDQQQVAVARTGTTEASMEFVLAPPEIFLAPTSVSFTAVEQGTVPNPARVAVSGSSGLELGTLSATVQFTGAGNWLSATIAVPTNEVVLQVTSTELPPGPHLAVVTVRSSRVEVPSRDIAVTFNVSARPPQTLSLTLQGSGNGRVTSLPAGLDCTRSNSQNTGTCSSPFPFGAQVALTPTPAQDHTFTGWSGACTGTGACTVTMNQLQNVTATFTAPPPQQLNLTLAGTGGGSVFSAPAGINCTRSNNQNTGTCNSTFTFAAQVALTPTPLQNHTFTGWSGACSGTGACTVTMNQVRSVTATFTAPPPQQLNVTLAGTGGGSVTSVPAGINCARSNNQNTGACNSTFTFGAQVALTPTPAQGQTFTGWSGACSGTGACTVTMNQLQNVTATFTAPPQQLNVTLAGAGGGSVSSVPAGINCTRSNNQNAGTCNSTFPFGSQVALTPTPLLGHTFTGWSGDCSGTGACDVTMNQIRGVTATFVIPAIGVTPASLAYSAVAGRNPVPGSRTFQVTNTGAGILNWSAEKTAPWLDVSPVAGVLSAGQSQTVTVTVTSSNLPPGNYTSSIVVNAAGIASRQVAITLGITSLSPTIFNLTTTLQVINDIESCSNGGSSFIARFSFTDPDGDVTMAVARIREDFVFSQGTTGTVTWPSPGFFYSVTGNGSSGTVSLLLCTLFAGSTSVTSTFTVIDGAGRQSNPLSVVTPRPPGSN